MALNWSDLEDTPENGALLLKARHVTSWSINEMECARMYALGHSERDTARVLGITREEVELALDLMTARIFIEPGWKAHFEPGLVVGWLYEHKACCVAEWEREVATTDPNELPEELRKDVRNLPRWRVWEDAARLREREDPRAPSIRRKRPPRPR